MPLAMAEIMLILRALPSRRRPCTEAFERPEEGFANASFNKSLKKGKLNSMQ
jgi:hypothetical protein